MKKHSIFYSNQGSATANAFLGPISINLTIWIVLPSDVSETDDGSDVGFRVGVEVGSDSSELFSRIVGSSVGSSTFTQKRETKRWEN